VALLGMLDSLCEPLRKTVVATLKENAVKQEVERHEELVRSSTAPARAAAPVRAIGCADRACVPRARNRRRATPNPPPHAHKPRTPAHPRPAQVKSGLRVSHLLSKISGAEGCVKFDEYVRTTLKQGKLAARYKSIMAEEEDVGADPMLT
jgi:hypothetical protein